MIDRDHTLALKRQAELLGISRGTIYYQPMPVSDDDLALMRRIDELHLQHPFAGSRMLRDLLRLDGVSVGRRHVATLMRRMGIEALYRRPNTSRKNPAHPVFPYLLRGLAIERANDVWALDITYVPMARGWVYLVAVLDWYSRRVLAHRVSITMEADFCVRRSTTPLPGTVRLRSSTPTRAVSLAAPTSSRPSPSAALVRAWTDEGAGSITSSSSDSGARSSTRRST